MPTFSHVTSTLNRASITKHGLDWSRMGAARGIAGSLSPEVAGIFLCTDAFEVDYFVRMNNTGGPVDVWAVEGIDGASLVTFDTGYSYLPEKIEATRLTLIRAELPPVSRS